MTEHDQPSAEYLAHAAVRDYLSAGPGPGFGELEVEALDEWIKETQAGIDGLSPVELTNLGWMYVERAWSRVTESGLLGQPLPSDLAEVIRNDLWAAGHLFNQAHQDASATFRPHIGLAGASWPIVESILNPQDELKNDAATHYLDWQLESNATLFKAFKENGQLCDIPSIDASLGMRLLTTHFLHTSYIPIVAAPRHSQHGAPSERWHAALHDRRTGRNHKVRFAPHAPPDFILFPPSLFGHADVPTTHGRGMLEAIAENDALIRLQEEFIVQGKILSTPPKFQIYQEQIAALHARASVHISAELARLQNPIPEFLPPKSYIRWFETLSPYADPAHESYGGALDIAISQLEMLRATGENTSESDYLLAWMYMESGFSLRASHTANQSTLIGSFERAEDLFAAVRGALPQAEISSSRYFELAIAESAAPMYRALVAQENVAEQRDIYCGQLAVLAPQILTAYEQLSDKTSGEARALAHLLHLVTAYLLGSSLPDTMVVLPGSPRQRGGHGDIPRGWDFTLWVFDSEDTYVLGNFYGRLETKEDPYSVDNSVATIAKMHIGSGNFRVLRSLIKGKPDKAISQARRHLLRMAGPLS